VLRTALLVALLSLVPAGAARASSVAIDPGPSPTRGETSTVTVTVQADEALALDTVRRPASGPPCAGTAFDDYKANKGNQTIGNTLDEQSSAPSGTYTFKARWATADTFRLCVWLRRGNGTTAASDTKELVVRVATGSLTTKVRQGSVVLLPDAFVTPVLTHVTGTLDSLGGSLVGFLRLSTGAACPSTPNRPNEASNITFRLAGASAFDHPGAFDVTGSPTEDQPLGRQIQVCTYLVSGGNELLAMTDDLLLTVSKPLNLGPPHVVMAHHGNPRPGDRATCQSTWRAFPKAIRFSYRWFRDGRPLGARGLHYVVSRGDAGHKLSCQVTGTNPIGSTTSPRSEQVRALPR
jgi:hypothetical protein